MSELRKLENGCLKMPPKRVEYDGRIWMNPPERILKVLGYKPVKYTEQPEPEAGFYFYPTYEETGTEIVQTWAKAEEPAQPADPDERLSAILRILSGKDE